MKYEMCTKFSFLRNADQKHYRKKKLRQTVHAGLSKTILKEDESASAEVADGRV